MVRVTMALVANDSSGKMWNILRAALFCADAERVHRLAIRALKMWSRWGSCLEFTLSEVEGLRRHFFGLDFPNPLGLAAGFDKNAEAIHAWQRLGFGFVEIGTVTAKSQEGNPKPRLFRLPRDQALLNRLGFNNDGAEVIARRIETTRQRHRIVIPIGVNIGKSKIVPNEDAPRDYRETFSRIADVADYVVINVSSPNTPGLRDLQQEEQLAKLLDVVCAANARRATPRPFLLKLSPDLDAQALQACARVAIEHKLVGLVVTNTTMARDGSGGISGQPLFERSTSILRDLHAAFSGQLVFIGVGGVMDAETAQEKFAAGADLIQTYTGFVYGGPGFPRRILEHMNSH